MCYLISRQATFSIDMEGVGDGEACSVHITIIPATGAVKANRSACLPLCTPACPRQHIRTRTRKREPSMHTAHACYTYPSWIPRRTTDQKSVTTTATTQTPGYHHHDTATAEPSLSHLR
ncbi:hypothetical protein BsWGS_26669 [Bradybaena similaris]